MDLADGTRLAQGADENDVRRSDAFENGRLQPQDLVSGHGNVQPPGRERSDFDREIRRSLRWAAASALRQQRARVAQKQTVAQPNASADRRSCIVGAFQGEVDVAANEQARLPHDWKIVAAQRDIVAREVFAAWQHDRAGERDRLFCAAHDVGAHFVIRSAYPRLADDGSTKTDTAMEDVRLKGLHRIEVRDASGEVSEAVLELKYRRMTVPAPVAKQKDYGPLEFHAEERDAPKNRERISWKLLTDLPVRTREEAIEKLKWYALRWKIELFHKILKCGCRVEASRLRAAPRLVNLIATCCVVAWRIFWITMINRSTPHAAPTTLRLMRRHGGGAL